jgi:putative phosphonate transport system ATP-binding protein
MTPPVLEVSGLTVRYGPGCRACNAETSESARCHSCGSVWACREVSFDIGAAEVVGIVGESGSGKSTVLACANLDIVPLAGAVRIEGMDVTRVAGSARRRLRAESLGIVYQAPAQGLDLELTVGGNIASRMLAAGVREFASLRDRASALVAETELPVERLDAITSTFSGGMQQRVQVAKALATRPPIVMLDEPTSGLDVSVQARLLDLLRRIQRETHLAVLIVSHDLGVIRMLADRLLVMRQGRVVERGLTDQVLNDPQQPYTQLLVSSQLT